jgi:hypothetical protein
MRGRVNEGGAEVICFRLGEALGRPHSAGAVGSKGLCFPPCGSSPLRAVCALSGSCVTGAADALNIANARKN